MSSIQPKYCSYFDPCSKDHLNVNKQFNSLSSSKKAQVILATVFAGIASFFMGGLGGLAVYRQLVRKWSEIKKSDVKETAAKKTDDVKNGIVPSLEKVEVNENAKDTSQGEDVAKKIDDSPKASGQDPVPNKEEPQTPPEAPHVDPTPQQPVQDALPIAAEEFINQIHSVNNISEYRYKLTPMGDPQIFNATKLLYEVLCLKKLCLKAGSRSSIPILTENDKIYLIDREHLAASIVFLESQIRIKELDLEIKLTKYRKILESDEKHIQLLNEDGIQCIVFKRDLKRCVKIIEGQLKQIDEFRPYLNIPNGEPQNIRTPPKDILLKQKLKIYNEALQGDLEFVNISDYSGLIFSCERKVIEAFVKQLEANLE